MLTFHCTILEYPRSCKDISVIWGEKTDGNHTLYPHSTLGRPIPVYCHNMTQETPIEYLNVDRSSNIVHYDPRRFHDLHTCNFDRLTVSWEEPAAHVVFDKIRLNINNLAVISDDFTFSETLGVFRPFGTAGDCHGHSASCVLGYFKIDLSKTCFKVNDDVVWSMNGWPKSLTVVDFQRLHDGVKISAKCGGSCGSCTSDGPLYLEYLSSNC